MRCETWGGGPSQGASKLLQGSSFTLPELETKKCLTKRCFHVFGAVLNHVKQQYLAAVAQWFSVNEIK